MLVGWLRALLLQIAHPLIAAGVADHSTFRGSTSASRSRLHQTIQAMLAITFGTPEQHDAAIERIRAIHRRVHGMLAVPVGTFPAGTPYSAEDPDLLLWVHVTLIESVVLAYEQLVEPLSSVDRDRYCADSAEVAIALGARPDQIPRTWQALRDCVAQRSDRLAVGPQAQQMASVLLSPLRMRFVRGAVAAPLVLLAAGQLPPRMRAEYGLPWNGWRARLFPVAVTLLRLARRLTPNRLAIWACARSDACFAVAREYSASRS